MKASIRFSALAVICATAVGCYGGGASLETAKPPVETPQVPVDANLTPVSRSEPGPDAAAALDACGITNFNPDQPGKVSANLGIDVVAGMGLIKPGRDAAKYAPLGKAPEIQTDDALWVITTNDTWLSFAGVSAELQHATCVVPDQHWESPSWLTTGDVRSGELVVTPPPVEQPVLRLPELTN